MNGIHGVVLSNKPAGFPDLWPMRSVALFQYPSFLFDKNRKELWNPLIRRRLVNRPEERVRLCLIEYLTRCAGWSPHRITTEVPVALQRSDTPNRADILCYDDQFRPALLIECKAETVQITEQTGQQIGRYNTQIKAPWLMISNGRHDFFFELRDGEIITHSTQPGIITPAAPRPPVQDFDYWSARGFAGRDAGPELRKWLYNVLPGFWSGRAVIPDVSDPVYLSLDPLPDGLAIDHYYRIYSYDPQTRIAFTWISTPPGGTRVVIILNRSGKNQALLVVNPELLLSGQSPNTLLFSRKGEKALNLQVYISADLFFGTTGFQWIGKLAEVMLELQ